MIFGVVGSKTVRWVVVAANGAIMWGTGMWKLQLLADAVSVFYEEFYVQEAYPWLLRFMYFRMKN